MLFACDLQLRHEIPQSLSTDMIPPSMRDFGPADSAAAAAAAGTPTAEEAEASQELASLSKEIDQLNQ